MVLLDDDFNTCKVFIDGVEKYSAKPRFRAPEGDVPPLPARLPPFYHISTFTSMAITIEMPRLSDSMHEGTVLRWFKKTGDFVKVGDHLADIETDKAHVELQACEDGTLTEILVP